MNYRVHSVALLLVNRDNLLYCVRELQSKPEIGKIVGSKDYSFPWETMEPEECTTFALQRLLLEEIDGSDAVEVSPPTLLGEVPVYDTLAHVYLASFLAGPENMRGTHAGIEIEPLGWQTWEFLLSRCRDGVPKALALWDQYRQQLSAC